MTKFRKVTVEGFTKEEATKDLNFLIFKDATQAWKKANMPMEKDLNVFMEEYLQKHTKNAEGLGCIITLKSGVADTRERPYKFSDVVNKKGKRTYKTGLQLTNKETGEVIHTVFGTKSEAKDYVRHLYIEEGFRGDIEAKYVKEVVDGEEFAFEVKYTPSVSATKGKWLCFGIEKE